MKISHKARSRVLITGLLRRALLVVTVLIIAVFSSCSPWRNAARRNMTIVFYNVENLFDTENQKGKQDDEFTPHGKKSWNDIKYRKKLADISKAISSVNEGDLPEIVGLCEVENRRVLNDLISAGLLSSGKYRIIHHDSPDTRGIDCALIYRPAEFKVTSHRAVKVRLFDVPGYKTRDILYVRGRTLNLEDFHIFVNHWPSRNSGVQKTEKNRIAVAGILKTQIDSVRKASPAGHIIVMGDMNDLPDDKSISEILGANPPGESETGLVNLMFPIHQEGRGSYNYKGTWNIYDQIIVSPGLLDETGFRVLESRGHVFRDNWMEFTTGKGQSVPDRTYGGTNYYGGVSDHFPVYIRLRR
ncbi:MAG: endonuclease [Prolixibacteraceae bacterium]|nr:endonuclease [Prolixibacteraceae bacterium]